MAKPGGHEPTQAQAESSQRCPTSQRAITPQTLPQSPISVQVCVQP
jgi:hypothetical protein